MADRFTPIPGSRVFTGPSERGRHHRATCSRCGRERQVNLSKMRHDDGLCADCRYVDPNVWKAK